MQLHYYFQNTKKFIQLINFRKVWLICQSIKYFFLSQIIKLAWYATTSQYVLDNLNDRDESLELDNLVMKNVSSSVPKLSRKTYFDDKSTTKFPTASNQSQILVRKEIKKAISTIDDFNDGKQINTAIMKLTTIKNRKSILNHIILNKERQNKKKDMQKITKLYGVLSKIRGKFLQLIPSKNIIDETVMDTDYFTKFNMSQKKGESKSTKSNLLHIISSLGSVAKNYSSSLHQPPEKNPEKSNLSFDQQSSKKIENQSPHNEKIEIDRMKRKSIRTKTILINEEIYKIPKTSVQGKAQIFRAKSRMLSGVYTVKSPQRVQYIPKAIIKKPLQHLTNQNDGIFVNQKSPTNISEAFDDKKAKRKEIHNKITLLKSRIEEIHVRKDMKDTYEQIINQVSPNASSRHQSVFLDSQNFTQQVAAYEQNKKVKEILRLQSLKEDKQQPKKIFVAHRFHFNNRTPKRNSNDRSVENLNLNRHQEHSQSYEYNMGNDDQSLISYTEAKLDNIYLKSIKLSREISKLDGIQMKGSNYVDTQIQDQIDIKSSMLDQNYKESMKALYRRSSQ